MIAQRLPVLGLGLTCKCVGGFVETPKFRAGFWSLWWMTNALFLSEVNALASGTLMLCALPVALCRVLERGANLVLEEIELSCV